MHKKERGFTLIELLIVIAIIAIIAGVVFVALNPAKRFADTRDARRANDVAQILNAIKVHQVDHGGLLIDALATSTIPVGEINMLGRAGCNTAAACVTAMTGTSCIDLGELVTDGYLGSLPISPNGTGSWSTTTSGYTIAKSASGIVTVRACEKEGSAEIQGSR